MNNLVKIVLISIRFIHPIVYGVYPRTMQEIVSKRLPKFTKEQVKMVKGSIDFVGINQYTTFYVQDPHKPKPKVLGYQEDWNAKFACTFFPYLSYNKTPSSRILIFIHQLLNPLLFIFLEPCR